MAMGQDLIGIYLRILGEAKSQGGPNRSGSVEQPKTLLLAGKDELTPESLQEVSGALKADAGSVGDVKEFIEYMVGVCKGIVFKSDAEDEEEEEEEEEEAAGGGAGQAGQGKP